MSPAALAPAVTKCGQDAELSGRNGRRLNGRGFAVRVRDAPIRDKAVSLTIHKRRFFCKPCRKPFTEPVAGIPQGFPLHRALQTQRPLGVRELLGLEVRPAGLPLLGGFHLPDAVPPAGAPPANAALPLAPSHRAAAKNPERAALSTVFGRSAFFPQPDW